MEESPRIPAIRVSMLPRETNGMGTIFGGAILSYVDLAGAIEARKTSRSLFVTKAMNEVVFLAPVFVGDTVSFYTCTERVGRTSVTVVVDVEVERRDTGETVSVTRANVTYVAVDHRRRPIPVRPDPAPEGGS
ncbi:MAG: acyl-CoA thioesterase [Planctomycetota bacterium JB042]